MTRHPDWVPRLRAAIGARWERPWAWGTFDCCTGPCDLVTAITGTDPMAGLRTYSTEVGSFRVLRRFAGKDVPRGGLLDAVAERLGRERGYPEVPVLKAQRGSLVLAEVPQPDGDVQVLACVALDGRHVITPKTEGGWAMLPLNRARRAWQVI